MSLLQHKAQLTTCCMSLLQLQSTVGDLLHVFAAAPKHS